MIEERIHIGQDLHDSIGAELVRINQAVMQAPFAENSDEIARLAREASRQLRDVVWSVSDIYTLDSLVAVITERIRTVGEESGMRVDIQVPLLIPETNLHPQLLRDVFLILTEAMTNVIKHSEATVVRFDVTAGPKVLTMCLEDNGRGYVTGASTAGRGLSGMQRRAERSQIILDCSSVRGKGSRVSLTIDHHQS
jgi:signal transduction histidine kinase